MPRDRIFRRWYEKYVCQKNTLVVQPVLYEGSDKPMIRFQIEHHCNGKVLAETLYSTDAARALASFVVSASDTAEDPNTFRGMMR